MWIYQAVTNVGVQVLVLMGLGYIFARFKLLEQAKFLPQSNFIVLMLALPAFNLYLMGIKLDLQSPEPWKSLAAFLLWVFVVQACILFYSWRFCEGDVGEAAVVNMVLLMDNFAITGLLALNATLGTKWGTLALLMAMGFFLVIFPFSLSAFELEKWAVQQHVEAIAESAALDIEAATAAAEAAEMAAGSGDAKQQPVGLGSAEPHLLASSERPLRKMQGGMNDAGLSAACRDGLELTLCPDAAGPRPAPEPTTAQPPEGGPSDAGGAPEGAPVVAAEQRGWTGGAGGFPHENRYCWWSNEEYRPSHPLLDSNVEQSEHVSTRAGSRQQWHRRHRRQEVPQEAVQQLVGVYVPPALLPLPEAHDHTSTTEPIVSPFQATSVIGWPTDAPPISADATTDAHLPVQPGTALPSAGRGTGYGASVNVQQPHRDASRSIAKNVKLSAAERSRLASMFDRLSSAVSGQLPPSMIGNLGTAGASPGTSPGDAAKPVGLQNLEFALTHKLSGGTACQFARMSRGYSAAAAAATAAAASPDANLRRMLLAATTGSGAPGRVPLPNAASRQVSEPLPTNSAEAACATSGVVPAIPRQVVDALGLANQSPLSAPSRSGGLGGPTPLSSAMMDGPLGAAVAGSRAVPASSLDWMSVMSNNSALGVSAPASPISAEVFTQLSNRGELACPTFSRQEGLSATLPSPSGSPPLHQQQQQQPAHEGHGRLASASVPVFSFTRRSTRPLNNAATVPGAIVLPIDGTDGMPDSPLRTCRGRVQRSASDTARVDKMLLTMASGLTLDGSRRRTWWRRGGVGTDGTPLLVDSEPNMMLQLADVLAGLEKGDAAAAVNADKELVREATREVMRRHGGLARALAAFVSGHPQLWHIMSTLAKNPMIWTMFIAMAVSVSGLRVFLDPASPKYRPEVGWVAGSLSWINGLVVPMSIFSNGAWMYGKPVVPKGELVKILVLLLIKVGVLPLLMMGCALLVQLDGQHVAAMTVLTLSPAAAASFVLAVQYGRGVELVSLTNILGNIFLTPLLIMWLKILTAFHIEFHLHDDG